MERIESVSIPVTMDRPVTEDTFISLNVVIIPGNDYTKEKKLVFRRARRTYEGCYATLTSYGLDETCSDMITMSDLARGVMGNCVLTDAGGAPQVKEYGKKATIIFKNSKKMEVNVV